MQRALLSLLVASIAVLGGGACSGDDGPGGDADADADVDGDTDADTDTDADGDGDTDADGDGDGDGDCLEPLIACPAVLVDAAWLSEHLDDPDLQVVDARVPFDFEAAHLPGALSVDVSLTLGLVDGLPNEMRPLVEVEDALGDAGVRADAPVVVYGPATNTIATRLVWALAWAGHQDVRLLDGGMALWTEAGLPIEAGVSTAVATDYQGEDTSDELVVDVDWVAAHLDDPSVVLVDARTGMDYEVAHIPGALSVPMEDALDGPRLRTTSELETLFGDVPDDGTVVAYCNTGMRATVTTFALRHLGYADVRLYDGSWSEWSSRGDLPQEP